MTARRADSPCAASRSSPGRPGTGTDWGDLARGKSVYRFETHRMVFELGIHEIGYAAW